ncbi:SseB family protein [Lachnospiraceae bacterium 45-P1]
MENKNAMQPEKQAAIRTLSGSEELYVLISLCTKMPFVMCDPETFDDEIFIYEKEEDIKREGKRFADQKIPLRIAKVARKNFLNFYANLFTMGVNCVVLNGYMPDMYKLQLSELVKKPGQKLPDGQIWVENPGLHLTALYFMQEVRRQKLSELTDELKEMQEEILTDYGKGTYVAAVHENNGIPLLKQKNGDVFQPVFTDILEFGKFNKDNQFKAVVVTAAKIPEILAEDAKGVVINPFGVNLQFPITKRPEKKRPEREQERE